MHCVWPAAAQEPAVTPMAQDSETGGLRMWGKQPPKRTTPDLFQPYAKGPRSESFPGVMAIGGAPATPRARARSSDAGLGSSL